MVLCIIYKYGFTHIYVVLGEEEVGLSAGGRQRNEEDGAEAHGRLDHQQCQVRTKNRE